MRSVGGVKRRLLVAGLGASSLLGVASPVQAKGGKVGDSRAQILELRQRMQQPGVEPNALQLADRDRGEGNALARTEKHASSASTDFDAALNLFRTARYEEAQTAFTQFLKEHPRSKHKPAAYFWLGQTHFALRDYPAAIHEFGQVVSLAPTHERAPEALFAVANCYVKLKQYGQARATLTDLVQQYPDSEAAAAARQRLQRWRNNA